MSEPSPPAALSIRILPSETGYRWYLRSDYSPDERSGWSRTRDAALVAVAGVVGRKSPDCPE